MKTLLYTLAAVLALAVTHEISPRACGDTSDLLPDYPDSSKLQRPKYQFNGYREVT